MSAQSTSACDIISTAISIFKQHYSLPIDIATLTRKMNMLYDGMSSKCLSVTACGVTSLDEVKFNSLCIVFICTFSFKNFQFSADFPLVFTNYL